MNAMEEKVTFTQHVMNTMREGLEGRGRGAEERVADVEEYEVMVSRDLKEVRARR